MIPGMEALADVLYDTPVDDLLAPDGPFFPVLAAMGETARWQAEVNFGSPASVDVMKDFLQDEGITGPLADACIAAAEWEKP